MARIQRNEYGVKIWLSARDTYDWARRPGNSWPCFQLSDRRVFAEFAPNGDLVDLSINGGRGPQDCDATEFNAITEDFLGAQLVCPICDAGDPTSVITECDCLDN